MSDQDSATPPVDPAVQPPPTGVNTVKLSSAATMEDIRNIAGRIEAAVGKTPYRASAFVPGQVETIDVVLGTRLDQELGFPAHSVIVDNPTTQWLFIQSAQRFAAPGLLGAVWQIPKASTQAQAQWRAPFGITMPANETGTLATLTFCEAFLMPTPGIVQLGLGAGMIGEVQIEGVDGTSIATVGILDGTPTATTPALLTTSQILAYTSVGNSQPVIAAPGSASGSAASLSVGTEGTKATYSGGIQALAGASGDNFTITGSATKTVRVTRVQISGVATAATDIDYQLLKRSTADTVGTLTNPPSVSHDSADPAATAVLTAYTVAPTPGALVGLIRARKITIPSIVTPGVVSPLTEWDFTKNTEKGLVLRGVAQQLCLNIPVFPAGGLFDIDVSWVEDNS